MEAEKHDARSGFKLKPLHGAGIAVAIALLIATAYLLVSNAAPTVVAAGDNISVYYTGSFTNGTVFNTNVGSSPFVFKVGANETIPGFDHGVVGMRVNETKTITLPPSEAYGPVDSNLIVAVPISQFANASVAVGMGVTASNGRQGIITAVSGNTVMVDFNPPLAGKTLVFKITIVSIRKG
ncbi:MAG: peptidylprolyl isomerase [Candidatus Micrarchaeota archaeon]|nr:peptidylprolyl isomerase [Candidatus Micrarchaeota archaeon]